MKSDEDRCKEYGVAYDPSITRKQVYEQSHWRCHICKGRVNPRRKYPHPKSPSLDHVVPLSWREKSPGHVWGNVALAHLRCNQQKGARYAGGSGSVPKRPSRFSLKTKVIFLLWTATVIAYLAHMSALVLTVLSVLCILSVVKRKSRRRRAWWRL